MMYHLAALGIGALVAVLWTRLVIAVEERAARRAGCLDFVLMLVGASAYQLWFMQGGKFSIFVAEAAGSAIATWWTVRNSK
jgi:hypothetical protein